VTCYLILTRLSALAFLLVKFMSKFKNGVIFGVAVNDSKEPTRKLVNGKEVMSPAYRAWRDMVKRAYSKKHKDKGYNDVSVCDEWLLFSNFKKWFDENWFEKGQLDKDLVERGNRIYSPDKCLIISSMVNLFILSNKPKRNGSLIGVYWFAPRGKWQGQISNPFTKKSEYLGYFTDEMEGHLAWKKRKHEFACMIADQQEDKRVADALRIRYLGDLTNE
jgi:hypothetical protein